jgi:hypothetical protein
MPTPHRRGLEMMQVRHLEVEMGALLLDIYLDSRAAAFKGRLILSPSAGATREASRKAANLVHDAQERSRRSQSRGGPVGDARRHRL